MAQVRGGIVPNGRNLKATRARTAMAPNPPGAAGHQPAVNKNPNSSDKIRRFCRPACNCGRSVWTRNSGRRWRGLA